MMWDWFVEWLHRDGVDEPLAVAPLVRQPLTLVGVGLVAGLASLASFVLVAVVLVVWSLGATVLGQVFAIALVQPHDVETWIRYAALGGASLGGAWALASWTMAVFRPLRERPPLRGLAVWAHGFTGFLLVQAAWISFAVVHVQGGGSLSVSPALRQAWLVCAALFVVVTLSAYWTYGAWGRPVSYRTKMPAGGGGGVVPDSMPVEATAALDNVAASAVPRGVQAVAHPGVSYRDLVGMDSTKRELLEAIRLMRDPATMERHGLDPVRGVLLHGPPGTGKTHFARATAGELGVKFLAVQSSDLVSKYVGETEQNIAAIFRYAREAGPALLFFDEFDALARDRSKATNDWEVSRVNTILTEMDGLTKDAKRPIVLAATNRLDDLDQAFLRPGRFDRRVYVGLPDATARRAMLTQFTKGRSMAPSFDAGRLVRLTDGQSAADLQRLVKDAFMRIYRENPTAAPRALTTEDFLACITRAKLNTR
jgi:AAA+ superfamily predicted ATPase